MDAATGQDLIITAGRDPYDVPPLRQEVRAMFVPEPGQKVGIKTSDTGAYLPFTFKGAGARCMRFVSPVNGSTFSFDLRDESWTWKPWEDCPPRLELCPVCRGSGEYTAKKTGQVTACTKCHATGKVKADDPFTAANRV